MYYVIHVTCCFKHLFMSPGVRNTFETGVYNVCKTRSFKQVFAPVPHHQLTCPLETVCVLLLDLVVALTKFLLVFFFSLEETHTQAFLLS